MIYEMNLNTAPFEAIVNHRKSVELRLYDYKRMKIDVGDSILFTDLGNPSRNVAVIVSSLHRYATFEDLFRDIPPERCGFDATDSPETAAAKMGEYYTDEQVQKFGVLGIGMALTDTDATIRDLEEQKEAIYDYFFPDGMK